ncbi:MAG: CYTH domain-containing protein [Candidatus Bathyarchaeia archaeon]
MRFQTKQLFKWRSTSLNPMKEIEAKILEIKKSKIEATLASLGAKKVFDGEIETFFFDFKDGAIAKAGNVMRLRRENKQAMLTFKNVLGNRTAKVAEEHSVEVSDLETAKKILEGLGLHVVESMQKHRVSYAIYDARFDIDQYKGDYGYIPEFIEIEAESIDLIHKYAKLLGFKKEDCLPWSTNELIHYYSSKKGKTES